MAEQTRRLAQQSHARIERTVLEDISSAVSISLEETINTVSGVAGLFNASGQVERREFRRYFEALHRQEGRLAGIQGIGFARFLTGSERQALIDSVRAEGFESFTIRPAGRRPLMSAIVFLEPFDRRNQRAFGFDMYSEQVRRRAMDQAALNGQPMMSGRVRLLQENGIAEQAGVLIYTPVYRSGLLSLPNSPSDYPAKLQGWAYAPIRVGDLIKASLERVSNPDLRGSLVVVQDTQNDGSRVELFRNRALDANVPLQHPQWQTLEIGGRSWNVGVQLSGELVGPNGFTPAVQLLLGFGAMASLLTGLGTHLLVKNHSATEVALAEARAANEERALATAVFEASPQAIVVTDPMGRVLSANQSFARITGYSGSEILGRNLSLLKSGRHDASFYADLWTQARERGFWQGEIWNRLRDGDIRLHELSITAVHGRDLAVSNYVGMLQDISERHRARQLLQHQALHDPLTGLPNRAQLMQLLNTALAAAKDQGHGVGVALLDLDGFKAVNDSYGHELGDRLLQMAGRRINGILRQGDTLFRLGGDEFVVLIPHLEQGRELSALGHRIDEAVAATHEDLEATVRVRASVGIARSPENGITAAELLRAADQAMYRAKREGLVVVVCEPAQDAAISRGS
ncbi:MAG: CHASE domain-containing protein [Synechococcaceae cyanobacterium]|nr:CHASE domain-containing protein [Synechococcaceae cyanobacterium]